MEVNDAFNAKLYIPGNISYSCCYTNNDYIYCYRTTNYNSYNTRDIFNTRLGYMRVTDSAYIGSNFNTACIENSRLTHDIWYRNDLHNILIIFLIIILIPMVLCSILLKRFRKR